MSNINNDRKTMIFDAMEKILSSGTFEDLTFNNISANCFLHVNTITYYFNSKDDMLIQFFKYVIEKDNRELPDFFSGVPQDRDPVKSFCELIDYIIDGGLIKSKTRRLLNQMLLSQTEINPEVLKFLNKAQEDSIKQELEAIRRYNNAGILNSEQERAAFSILTLMSAGISLIHYFHVQCIDYEYGVKLLRLNIKQQFLKPEFYGRIPEPEEIPQPEEL